MNRNVQLPSAREMIPALVAVLMNHEGVLSVREIERQVALKLGLQESQLQIAHDKSRTEFQYRLAWTRSYAKKEGLAFSPSRNCWTSSPS